MSKRKRALKMVGKTMHLGIVGDCLITGIEEVTYSGRKSGWEVWGGRRNVKTDLCYAVKPLVEIHEHLKNIFYGYRKKTGDFLVRVVDRIYYEARVHEDYPQ